MQQLVMRHRLASQVSWNGMGEIGTSVLVRANQGVVGKMLKIMDLFLLVEVSGTPGPCLASL
jgi:hypothetical protein